ncbi:hypothetical protein [Fulvivirga marina]|nr:hypothetical protein [Fulvivirga marina]
MVKTDLIEIMPKPEVSVRCVNCQSQAVDVHGYLFEGIHVLWDCICPNCNTIFYQTLPISHDALFPIAFSKDGLKSNYNKRAEVWLAKPLIHAVTRNIIIRPAIEIKQFKEFGEAILLNCLDDCFGHVYAKLWNAQRLLEKYPEKSVIVLIPRKMQWLIPEGVAEVWLVDVRFKEMEKYIANLDDLVKKEMARFSHFYVAVAPVFLDTDKVDDYKFLKVEKFELKQFNDLKPQVTFVLREDRFWHANRMEEFLNRVLIKFKWQRYFRRLLVWRQNKLVKQAIRRIKASSYEISFVITGLGSNGSFGRLAKDRRVDNISVAIEREWCEIYAKSHIVVGVHGSNMLIPTSLAAGFIEILPEYKISHMGEDTVMRYSGRYAMLLGRHVDAFIHPALLAQHVLHMLNFGELYEEIESNS